MRILWLFALIVAVGYVAQVAIATDQVVTLLPWGAALIGGIAGVSVSLLTRRDSVVDRLRLRRELVTLLAAELHNFSRHHATNLRRLSSVFEKVKRKSELTEMLGRFSFSGRPGSDEGELFKVTSVEQLAHLPRFLSRDFMRVHTFARNVEDDIKRARTRICDDDEEAAHFQATVTDELYRLGLRLERATVQGELLLERLEAYENQNRIGNLLRRLTMRLMQRPGFRTFIDRPMQPDDTRAYEELDRWRDIVRRRNAVTDDQVRYAIDGLLGENAAVQLTETSGLFNEVIKVTDAGTEYSLRWRKNEELFRYDYRIMKDVFVTRLYDQNDPSQMTESEVAALVVSSEVGIEDHVIRLHPVAWPGPKVVGYGSKDGRPFVMSEWLEGRTGKDISIPDYRLLGAHVASLHRMTFDGAFPALRKRGVDGESYLKGVQQEIIARNHSSGQIVEERQLVRWLADRSAKVSNSLKPANLFVLCHNDLHPFNVFVTPTGIRLIDWDNLVIAHPYLDFVKAKYWSRVQNGYLTTSLEAFNEFCAGYELEGARQPVSADNALSPVNRDPIFQLHEMLWLLRIWTFETGRENAGSQRLGPFPAASYYEPMIWRLVS